MFNKGVKCEPQPTLKTSYGNFCPKFIVSRPYSDVIICSLFPRKIKLFIARNNKTG